MVDIVPSNVVAAYRVRRKLLSQRPAGDPAETFRPLGDVLRDVILECAETAIHDWRDRRHG